MSFKNVLRVQVHQSGVCLVTLVTGEILTPRCRTFIA